MPTLKFKETHLVLFVAATTVIITEEFIIVTIMETTGVLMVEAAYMADIYILGTLSLLHETKIQKAPVIPFAALSARVIKPARQLPTYNGTKSYQNLLVGVYGGTNTGWPGWENSNMGTIPHNAPINLVRSGFYFYSSGSINNRNSYGTFWELRTNTDVRANYLDFRSTYLTPQDSYDKGRGYTLRCLER